MLSAPYLEKQKKTPGASVAARTGDNHETPILFYPRPDIPKPTSSVPQKGKGLPLRRRFTKRGESPYDLVDWELRTAVITNEKGEVVFEQKDCEIPASWSMMATNVVVSKYFRGPMGSPSREHSVRQLIGRVVDTITAWGKKGSYFAKAADAEAFQGELTHILLHQFAAFNSPVWFNVGVEKKPQCSACFINSVKDTMSDIMALARTEGMLFKFGSGTGTNLSTLRSSRETLQGGGTASGPVSFMKGFDAFAGVIKSGGKTRRAAKMVILNIDHPDILDFIDCKAREEKKAWDLIDAGYDGSFNGEAYSSVFFQNSNNSVRVTDEFMRTYLRDDNYETRYVKTGDLCETFQARDLMRRIADAAWICGDPGLQFDSITNRWNTCKKSARINASNPCSEFVFLDDTACNLASINLLKFLRADGSFDVEAFRHTAHVVFLAQEIMVSYASYPTEKIAANSEKFRPLGLGYANLGALLMALGVPYDSDEGRAVAATLSAILTGEGYRTSAALAASKGPFEKFEENRESALEVMQMHRCAAYELPRAKSLGKDAFEAALWLWDEVVGLSAAHGIRNAQATVIAPTGTIGFMMDCDTTGIEPDLALVKYKKLVGGGLMKIVNNTVGAGLKRLGYTTAQADSILCYIEEQETIEGAPELREEHLPVFDCSFRPMNGKRSIEYMGHIRMMQAVQPFVSGAISKTVNMPNDATVEDIERVYLEAWRRGLKALAIYRDGCKRTQPLNTGRSKSDATASQADAAPVEIPVEVPVPASIQPLRHRLPAERQAITHKFQIGGHEGYITIGLYEDGSPGELFIRMAKEGSTISGLMDCFATSVSIALQYGVPLEVLIKKFTHTRFEPSGFTKNPKIPRAKSIMDYIFRYLAYKFLDAEKASELGVISRNDANAPTVSSQYEEEGAVNALARPDSEYEGPVEGSVMTPPQTPPVKSNGRRQEPKNGGAESSHHLNIESSARVYHNPVFHANQVDAPPCPECGEITVRNGSCYKCLNCGASLGCG